MLIDQLTPRRQILNSWYMDIRFDETRWMPIALRRAGCVLGAVKTRIAQFDYLQIVFSSLVISNRAIGKLRWAFHLQFTRSAGLSNWCVFSGSALCRFVLQFRFTVLQFRSFLRPDAAIWLSSLCRPMLNCATIEMCATGLPLEREKQTQ